MAKEKRAQALPGDEVRLAQTDGGFYDPQTEFKIVRDETATLGKTIGAKTNRALVSGGLLIVGSGPKSKVQDPKSEDDGSGFAEDFIGRETLIENGFTLDKILALSDEEAEKLIDINGIGPKAMERIRETRA